MNTAQYTKPAVGSKVSVTVRSKDDYLYATSPFKDMVLEGIVLPNHKLAQPDAFTLRVKCANVPVREIRMKAVVDLQYADGSTATTQTVEANSVKTLVVKGSKGEDYVVTKDGSKVSCTCVGFQYRKTCKHLGMIK